jgi:hypothetical protein
LIWKGAVVASLAKPTVNGEAASALRVAAWLGAACAKVAMDNAAVMVADTVANVVCRSLCNFVPLQCLV